MKTIDLEFMSVPGREVALMALANSAGNSAASKYLGELNAEAKALADEEDKPGEKPAIDKFNDSKNVEHEHHEAAKRPGTENGSERQVPAVEYAILLAAVNDAILTMAGVGVGTWPVPATPEIIVQWKCKASTPGAVTDEDTAIYKQMLDLIREGAGDLIKDEELHAMLVADKANQAVAFSEMFQKHADGIIDRMHMGMREYDGEHSWEILFNQLPARIQLGMLRGIDGRLESTIKRIFSGKKADGTPAASAKRQMADRLVDMMMLRADQKALRPIIALYAAEEAGPEALGSKSGTPGTSVKGAVPSAGPKLEPKEERGTRQVSDTEFRGTKPKPATAEQVEKLKETVGAH